MEKKLTDAKNTFEIIEELNKLFPERFTQISARKSKPFLNVHTDNKGNKFKIRDMDDEAINYMNDIF